LDNDKFDSNKYQLALESENSSNEHEKLKSVVQQIEELLEELLTELIDIINNEDLTNIKESITKMTSKVCNKGREICDLI